MICCYRIFYYFTIICLYTILSILMGLWEAFVTIFYSFRNAADLSIPNVSRYIILLYIFTTATYVWYIKIISISKKYNNIITIINIVHVTYGLTVAYANTTVFNLITFVEHSYWLLNPPHTGVVAVKWNVRLYFILDPLKSQ